MQPGNSKILFVIDNLGSGGAQNQIVMLALELKKKGYSVCLFMYHPQDFFKNRLDAAQIPVFFRLKKDKVGIGVIISLIRICRTEDPDLVISFLDTPNFYSAVVKRFCKRKIKLITSERSSTEFGKKSIRLLLKKISHNLADHIVTNSMHEKLSWEKHYPAVADKISCIYNGVDLNRFTKKECFGFTFKLLCIGSVSPFKNGLFVIEVLNILRNKYNLDISVTWAGIRVEHIKSREEYFMEMKVQIEKYKLEKFWRWEAATGNIVDFMHAHDALIHTALVEGLPNVVCEALTCGLPVFVSNLLDHPFLVKDNVNGFLIPVDDADEAAKKIVSFYAMPKEKIINLSAEARHFASEHLSIDKMVSEYMNLFNSMNDKAKHVLSN